MKTLKSIALSVLVLALSLNASIAQNYKSQFNVNSSGKAVDANGVQLGSIEADGTIKNSKGEVVGKIVKKDKEAELLDKLGKKMGASMEDGTFKDDKGKVAYTLSTADENGICKIKNAAGKEVGTVHENYKQQGACAYHCLAANKKK